MPYQENPKYVRVNGADGTGISAADLGTTLPTTLTEDLDAAFKTGLGILHDGGITLSIEKEITDIHGLAGGKLARRLRGKVTSAFKFGCLEMSAAVMDLRFPAAWELVGTAGPDQFAKKSLTEGLTAAIQKVLVFDLFDNYGGSIYRTRIIGSNFDVESDGDMMLANNKEATVSMFTATPLAGSVCDIYTNNPGVLEQLTATP